MKKRGKNQKIHSAHQVKSCGTPSSMVESMKRKKRSTYKALIARITIVEGKKKKVSFLIKELRYPSLVAESNRELDVLASVIRQEKKGSRYKERNIKLFLDVDGMIICVENLVNLQESIID
jgi:predicted nucleic acid-binding OB-fold protein